MKQKFTLIKNDEQKKIIIKEYAELDKDILSLLCEETYDMEMVSAAIASGKEAVNRALRTKNMYPPSAYMNQIAETVIQLFEPDGDNSKDLLLNDMDLLLPPEEEIPEIEDEIGDGGNIDDLLDDDDEVDEKLEVEKLQSSLKIADEESDTGDND